MKKSIFMAAVVALSSFTACSDNEGSLPGEGIGNGGGSGPSLSDSIINLGGYADYNGVMLLNGGARMLENGSLTFISGNSEVEQYVYRNVNGSELGNDARDMYLYNGKLYIICADYIHLDSEVENDGALIIADAVTLRKEKAYRLEDLSFEQPDGMRPEFVPDLMTFSNIAVLDERNVFIRNSQALFRFDSTTETLSLVEGSYHIANGGGSIEPLVSSKGMAVVNDRLYMGVGGFWASTGVHEYVKDKNVVNRELELDDVNLISGVCAGEDDVLWIATYDRASDNKSKIHKINVESFTVEDTKTVKANLSPGYENTSGISASGDRLYFTGETKTLKYFTFDTGKVTEVAEISAGEGKNVYINCNPVVDPVTEFVYVAVSDENRETVKANNSVFIYDCSGEEPFLKQTIENKTSYVSGIYNMSRFY